MPYPHKPTKWGRRITNTTSVQKKRLFLSYDKYNREKRYDGSSSSPHFLQMKRHRPQRYRTVSNVLCRYSNLSFPFMVYTIADEAILSTIVIWDEVVLLPSQQFLRAMVNQHLLFSSSSLKGREGNTNESLS